MFSMQICGKQRYMSLYGILFGPSKIKDLQPVLKHFVQELMELDAGISVWDAFRQERFTLRGRLFCSVQDNRGSLDILLQSDAG